MLMAALILVGATAQAQPTKARTDERAWHLGVEGLTDFALQVGVQVWVEMPYRFRLTMSAGEMPDAYLQAINSVAVSAGVYKQSTADFMTEIIDRAVSWRLQAGWRPFRRRGAYVEAGFGILTVEKGLALADVIQLATGLQVPEEARIGLGYEVHTVVETLGIELGWIWYPWRDLTVRCSIAFAAPVGAQVSIHPNFASTIQQPFTSAAESRAEHLLETDLLLPTVGLAVGWRLF